MQLMGIASLHPSCALARAISLKAMWSVMRVDIRRLCEKRRLDPAIVNAEWQEALRIITGSLITRRVPVS